MMVSAVRLSRQVVVGRRDRRQVEGEKGRECEGRERVCKGGCAARDFRETGTGVDGESRGDGVGDEGETGGEG